MCSWCLWPCLVRLNHRGPRACRRLWREEQIKKNPTMAGHRMPPSDIQERIQKILVTLLPQNKQMTKLTGQHEMTIEEVIICHEQELLTACP